ncbi:hypothetical protein MUP37_04060 [Candidatus Bathyarchaeota archaeon]|nr:hypothetical protein [Candidatus Bathyarchaeota archaeon]
MDSTDKLACTSIFLLSFLTGLFLSRSFSFLDATLLTALTVLSVIGNTVFGHPAHLTKKDP